MGVHVVAYHRIAFGIIYGVGLHLHYFNLLHMVLFDILFLCSRVESI